jgi:hypothetical protein
MVNVNNGIKSELRRPPGVVESTSPMSSHVSGHEGQTITTVITLPPLTASQGGVHNDVPLHTTSTLSNGVLITTTPCYENPRDHSRGNDQNVELTYLKNFSSTSNQNSNFMFHYADYTEIGSYGQELDGEVEINLNLYESFTDPNSNRVFSEKA